MSQVFEGRLDPASRTHGEMSWMTAQQVADLWGVSEVTVRRHAKAGHVPYRKVGRLMRFMRSDVEAGTGTVERPPRPATAWRDELRALDPYADTA